MMVPSVTTRMRRRRPLPLHFLCDVIVRPGTCCPLCDERGSHQAISGVKHGERYVGKLEQEIT